jgi:hypothetical protein
MINTAKNQCALYIAHHIPTRGPKAWCSADIGQVEEFIGHCPGVGVFTLISSYQKSCRKSGLLMFSTYRERARVLPAGPLSQQEAISSSSNPDSTDDLSYH